MENTFDMEMPKYALHPSAVAAQQLCLWPDFRITPLLQLPQLADRLGVREMMAKDEGQRMLGSFKSLGGTYAGLRALARAAGTDVASILGQQARDLPTLICASDGNHGLAVAAAARLANGKAQVFLHRDVSDGRARLIQAQGGEVVWVPGNYDDAVEAAARAARSGAGILVADTTDDPTDPVVQDVMAGYGVMALEIRDQVQAHAYRPPTHIFVQAGVGGLAAAMAGGLSDWLSLPGRIIVVEPEAACCFAAAFAAGRPVRIGGSLQTAAGMLSCGTASAAALDILRRHGTAVVSVPEPALEDAPKLLRNAGGPLTTPSGAAGLAGVIAALADPIMKAAFQLGPESCILVVVTERLIEGSCDGPNDAG